MNAFVVEHYGKDGVRAADVPEPEVGAVTCAAARSSSSRAALELSTSVDQVLLVPGRTPGGQPPVSRT
jgi:hypothetical protein